MLAANSSRGPTIPVTMHSHILTAGMARHGCHQVQSVLMLLLMLNYNQVHLVG
jgi:hypothetical protein